MVHVVEEELIRSNALRAYLVGYLLGVTNEAIGRLRDENEEGAAVLAARLKEIYPLIEQEFYGVVAAIPKPSGNAPDHSSDESVKG